MSGNPPKKISNEIIETILDFERFCPTFLKIKDKQGRIIPFAFNKPQLILWKEIKELWYAGKPIRIIILKARQEGISTLIEAFIFWLTYTNQFIKCCVIGHEGKASGNLFEMYKRFYNYLPEELRLDLKKSNAKILEFLKMQSSMQVLTAEGREGVARSDTLQVIHATEVAFYPDAESVMTAMLQSLSDTGHYFEESTANGIGGRFFDDWQSAKAGENGMTPVFLAWFDLPDYRLPFNNEKAKQALIDTLTDVEKHLIQTYQLTYEQLNWRRETIKFKCFNKEDIFRQEYPSNDVEAFLVSGRPVFDVDVCMENYNQYERFKPVKFRLDDVIGSSGKVVAVERTDDPSGYYTCLEDVDVDPNEDYRFAIGCDVSEGLEQGDYTAMDVLDRKQMKYVIKFHGHIDPDLLAEEQRKLQMYLKRKCYFCTERNNHGLTTISVAYRLKVKQYYQTNYAKGYEVDTNSLGFKTSVMTKPLIINDLNKAIRQRAFVDEDRAFWKECLTFVKNASGQMQAQGKDKDPNSKCYDDRVISKALSIVCHQWMPNYSSKPQFLNSTGSKVKDITDF